MPDEQQPDDALNQFWNTLGQPGQASGHDGISPDLAETLRRLHALALAAPPDRARLRVARAMEQTLAARQAAPARNGHAASYPRDLNIVVRGNPVAWDRNLAAWLAGPQAASPPSPVVRGPLRAAILHLATALLLLLTLGLGILATRPLFRDTDHMALLPAAVPFTSTPAPVIPTDEALQTVFTATLPARLIPAAGNLDFLVWRTTLEPGIRTSYQGQIKGFQMQHVISGELELTADGPLQLVRGSSGPPGMVSGAEAAPGAIVVLHPGDTAIFPFDQTVEYANLASAPVELVAGGLFAGHGAWLPEGMSRIDHNEQYPVPELPAGPVDLTLVRATLPPGAEVTAPPAGSLTFDVGAVEESSIAKRPDGALRNIGPDEAAIYVLTLTPRGG